MSLLFYFRVLFVETRQIFEYPKSKQTKKHKKEKKKVETQIAFPLNDQRPEEESWLYSYSSYLSFLTLYLTISLRVCISACLSVCLSYCRPVCFSLSLPLSLSLYLSKTFAIILYLSALLYFLFTFIVQPSFFHVAHPSFSCSAHTINLPRLPLQNLVQKML